MHQREVQKMDDQLRELRRISSILLLAHSGPIELRMGEVMARPPSRVLVDLLRAGEMKTERLEVEAKAGGVSRSTMFRTIGDLERSGVVERPRRGVVALTEVAASFADAKTSAPGSPAKGTDAT